MKDKKELATIKPSEHLELIMYRMEEMLIRIGGDLDEYSDRIESEARRLKAWLEETGN